MPLTSAAVAGAAGFAAALATGASAVVVGAAAGVTAALLAVVSLVVAAGRIAPRRGAVAAWRWLAAGALAWLIGVGLRPVADDVAFAVTFADLPVLVGTVLLAGGAWLAAGARPQGHALLRYITDSYLCAASLFVLAWVVVLGPVYREIDDSSAFVVPLLAPMVCLVAACAVGPAVVAARAPGWPVGLAGLAVLAATTGGELATGVARLAGEDPPIAAVWLAPVAFLLLAAAPWSGGRVRSVDALAAPDPEAVPDPEGDNDGVRATAGPVVAGLVAGAPLTLVALATGFVLSDVIRGGVEAPVPLISTVIASVVLVLLLRLFVLLAEGARLRRLVRLGERQLRELAESTGDVVLLCDHEGVISEIGDAVETVYGYRPADLLGGSIFDYIHPEDAPAIRAALRDLELDDDPPEQSDACLIACRVRAADGTWRPTESVATRHLRGEDLLMISARDISDQEALRNQVAHLTFHDGVTGLPNRAYFEERTREVLAGRSTGRSAVIFLDLDGFTAVNDSVGHASGDYLLGQAARRLRSAVRSDDTLARWGGDEFAVLVESNLEAQAVVDLAERLVRAVSQEPFRVADRDIALTGSVGVAFAEDGVPSADLIRNADVAMARAKEQGGRRVEVFAAHMHADVVRRLELAADLQRALLDRQFAVEYQPIVDLATSRVTAVEALVRWWRGSTFVPPEQFLGPAEDTGLIVPLSEWILRESCREVAAWRASSWDIGLSVNLSARQITAPRFVETVSEALAESGLPPSALTLEVIEEMLVEDAEETITRLSELRELGVRLAIDDFGTGYASLAYLRQLPVDMIKIDPSFVSGLGRDDTLSLLTRTIVRLGHDLGLIVVAEGIERPEQLELLREMGCTRGQGYLVARPMAARGVASLIRTSLQSTA
ncbi:GGDEF domain-containing phosphodiesterase [Spongiactinospora sp. TRM90649]|uniref:GGDEF domain-containing phosphodiesterase n=1 Tax=Spongiactinospora sp. TRM90649 TaxID=3031114 RepID=UPI0023F9B2F0|nr:GGDEF domain-containing phosphodiesterase [Spongiactinospora sp. TRM90649]MDF5753391.1 EAL domain-containing protein [Spongiactinospora sp. TRM90649]